MNSVSDWVIDAVGFHSMDQCEWFRLQLNRISGLDWCVVSTENHDQCAVTVALGNCEFDNWRCALTKLSQLFAHITITCECVNSSIVRIQARNGSIQVAQGIVLVPEFDQNHS